MEYLRLGSTGLEVSRLVLGCMSFGEPKRGAHPRTLDEESSRPLIRQALEAGINFVDAANVYSAGTSEEIVGRALRDFGPAR
jgi:aryl-alcohol dehydrogenase (NADP+)